MKKTWEKKNFGRKIQIWSFVTFQNLTLRKKTTATSPKRHYNFPKEHFGRKNFKGKDIKVKNSRFWSIASEVLGKFFSAGSNNSNLSGQWNILGRKKPLKKDKFAFYSNSCGKNSHFQQKNQNESLSTYFFQKKNQYGELECSLCRNCILAVHRSFLVKNRLILI